MSINCAIELRGVSKSFSRGQTRVYVLHDLSLKIETSSEIVVLLGPSGCGKTTLLKLMSGLLLPEEGEVLVDGKVVDGPGSKSATVPQAYTCFPWLTVLANVEFGLALDNIQRGQRREIAMNYLARVGLADRYDSWPKQLSNGMQQRVAIARALSMRRPIVLMDEPFGALDAQTRSEMQALLLELWGSERNLIIFVTHDITEALYIADRLVVFSARPAHVLADIRSSFPWPRTEPLQHTEQFVQRVDELRRLLRSGSTAFSGAHAT